MKQNCVSSCCAPAKSEDGMSTNQMHAAYPDDISLTACLQHSTGVQVNHGSLPDFVLYSATLLLHILYIVTDTKSSVAFLFPATY